MFRQPRCTGMSLGLAIFRAALSGLLIADVVASTHYL